MLRTLLEDRFKLVARMEARPAPVYALVPARRDRRLGPKLRKAEECGATGRQGIGRGPGVNHLTCATVAELAWGLSEFVGRPVIDQTGLSGSYDATFEWTPSEEERHVFGDTSPADARPPATGPSIFTALQERLGLKLESRRGTVGFLLITSAEKPAEN